MPSTRAVAYLRVSTESQAEEGVSLDAQEHRVRAYATAFGLELVDVIRDAGASAKDLDRAGLRRALAILDTGAANTVVIAKLDRLTRSVRDLAVLLERYFVTGRASLVSVGEHIDTSSAAGRLVLNVLVSVGQWEREAICERTREALRHLRRTGVHVGAAGVGWRYTEAVGADGRRVVERVDEEVRVIDRMRELRADGLSARRIADALTAEGWPTKRGGRWHPGTVHRLLSRAAAAAVAT